MYLLKKNGATYYIGYFSATTTALTITYKKAFYHIEYDSGQYPRGVFKDETNFFAVFNLGKKYYNYYGWYSTGYRGGQIFAYSTT